MMPPGRHASSSARPRTCPSSTSARSSTWQRPSKCPSSAWSRTCPTCPAPTATRKYGYLARARWRSLRSKYGLDLIGEVPLDPLNSGHDELPADRQIVDRKSRRSRTSRKRSSTTPSAAGRNYSNFSGACCFCFFMPGISRLPPPGLIQDSASMATNVHPE